MTMAARNMYRVLFTGALVALAALAAGCSMGSSSLSSNLADAGSDAAPPAVASEARRSRQGALGGEPTARGGTAVAGNQRTAALDQAPRGSFDKAPTGSLADRDYSSTRLDADKARDLINQYRAQHKLKPLKLNAELSAAAKAHSLDLAKWDRISHFGSDGSNPWDRVKRAGYNARLAAENVGTGQVAIEEVFKGWKESPGHNKNLLLADAEHMGIALVHDPKTEFKTFWTLVFGTPM